MHVCPLSIFLAFSYLDVNHLWWAHHCLVKLYTKFPISESKLRCEVMDDLRPESIKNRFLMRSTIGEICFKAF